MRNWEFSRKVGRHTVGKRRENEITRFRRDLLSEIIAFSFSLRRAIKLYYQSHCKS